MHWRVSDSSSHGIRPNPRASHTAPLFLPASHRGRVRTRATPCSGELAGERKEGKDIGLNRREHAGYAATTRSTIVATGT